MCEIDSFSYIKDLLYKYEDNVDRILEISDIADLAIYYWSLSGYDLRGKKVITPNEQFFKEFNYDKQFKYIKRLEKQLLKSDNISSKELMRLGLSIDYDTYTNFSNYFEQLGLNYEDRCRKLTK